MHLAFASIQSMGATPLTESAYPSAEEEALKYCRKCLEQAILHYIQKELCFSMILLRIEISVLDFLEAIIAMLHTV